MAADDLADATLPADVLTGTEQLSLPPGCNCGYALSHADGLWHVISRARCSLHDLASAVRRATFDPGKVTKRGEGSDGRPYGEPLHAWRARAVLEVIRPWLREEPAGDKTAAAPRPVDVAIDRVRRDLGAKVITCREAEQQLVAAGCTQGAAEVHAARFAADALRSSRRDGKPVQR